MKKQFIKLCLASILSLSLNTNLQAQDANQPILATPQATFTVENLREVQRFIQEVQTTYSSVCVEFSAPNSALTISTKWSPSIVNIDNVVDNVLESLVNQDWLTSLKRLTVANLPTNINTLSSVLFKTTNLKSLSLHSTPFGLPFSKLNKNQLDVLAPAIKVLDLHELDLSHNPLNSQISEKPQSLFEILLSQPHLQTLKLADSLFSKELLESLAPVLVKLPELQTLDLSYNSLGDKLLVLESSLSRMPKLQTLSLKGNDLGQMKANDLQALVKFLSSISGLQNLDLGDNSLGTISLNDWPVLKPLATFMPQLQVLNLRGNNLGLPFPRPSQKRPESFNAFVDFLSSATNLQVLNLCDNKLKHQEDSEIQTLANYLSSAAPTLRQLNLAYTGVGQKIEILTPALKQMTTLHVLNLAGNNLGDKGDVLISILDKMPNLQELDLRHTNLRQEMEKLKPVLARMPHLQSLVLSDNSIDAEALISLLPSFFKMTSLQKLDLSGNNLGQTGRHVLTTLLSRTSKLEILDLSCSGLQGPAIAGFADAIFEAESIAEIPNLANYIDRPLPPVTRFLEIDFRGNRISEDEYAELQAALAAFNPAINVTF